MITGIRLVKSLDWILNHMKPWYQQNITRTGDRRHVPGGQAVWTKSCRCDSPGGSCAHHWMIWSFLDPEETPTCYLQLCYLQLWGFSNQLFFPGGERWGPPQITILIAMVRSKICTFPQGNSVLSLWGVYRQAEVFLDSKGSGTRFTSSAQLLNQTINNFG